MHYAATAFASARGDRDVMYLYHPALRSAHTAAAHSLITFGSMLGLVSHHVELREEEALATGRAVVRGPLAQSACGRLGWRGHGRGGLEGRVVCRSGRWLLPGLPPRWGWGFMPLRSLTVLGYYTVNGNQIDE